VISGFSFIKNGVNLGYPFRESLLSLAPLVDEVVIAHGDSSDSTLKELELLSSQFSCPLRIISSPWNPLNSKKGSELARQTDIALENCKGDVCFYLQGDEILPDADTNIIKNDLIKFSKDPDVDVLVFDWIHFYYSYNQYVYSKKWYRREARVIKKSHGLKSFGDAQGFRIYNPNNQTWSKARAALSKGRVFHYGWVRPPQVMAEKTQKLDQLWHGNKAPSVTETTVYKPQYGLRSFQENHPKVMLSRIQKSSPEGDLNLNLKWGVKYFRLLLSDILERLTGIRLGEFQNFIVQKKY
jgi:hypothetical protein